MGTTVSLSDADLAVDPGSSITTTMRVRNTGEVVDQITFQPLGDAARWIRVEPPSVRLFPNTDEVVTVSITPPREPSSPPGATDWAVRAQPQEDPQGSAVAEGTVNVGMFADVGAEMQPEIGHGRLRGRYELAIDNRGNVPVPIRATGTDAEQSLEIDINPPIIDCEPGSARFATIKVKPAKRIWKGQPKTYAFEILAEPQILAPEAPPPTAPGELPSPTTGGGTALLEAPAPPATPSLPAVAPITLTGTYVQVPILPSWFWKAVIAVVALAVLLFVLWQTLFKSTIESAARETALEETEAIEADVAAIDEKVDEAAVADAAQKQQTAEDIATLEEQNAGAETSGGALGNVFNETTEPANFRLSVSAAPGASATTLASTLPAGTTFALTDVILQNPRGDNGIISVQLGGVPIIESSLGNFRDLDFHFVAPYVSDGSSPLSVVVECDLVQIPADGGCSPAVSFSGFETVSTAPAGG